MLDHNKLPVWQREVLQKTSSMMLKTPESAILSGLNAKASQYLQMPRIKIESPEDKAVIPCNYYGILFMPSGSGKDRLLNYIQDNFFAKSKSFFVGHSELYMVEAIEDLEKKILDISTKSAQELYRQAHSPRYLSLQSSDGTPEGFIADREAYQIAGFGGTFFQNSEFVNFLKTKDNNKESLLSLIGEVFDKGNSTAKTIKGNKKCISVEGVPSTMFVHTTVSDIHKSDVFEQILESLNRQLARRSFICFPEQQEFRGVPESPDDLLNYFNDEKDNTICELYNNKFAKIIEKIMQQPEAIYTLSEDAKLEYYKYWLECNSRASLFDVNTKDGLISEILGRSWKMIKLAGIIHSFKQDWFVKDISSETIREAIYQTEYFGKYFERFYSFTAPDEVQLCYDWIKGQKGKQILKTDIRAKGFVNRNKFAHWFDSNIETIKDISAQEGLIFEEISGTRNIKAYILKEII
jgi:hypothetical protein